MATAKSNSRSGASKHRVAPSSRRPAPQFKPPRPPAQPRKHASKPPSKVANQAKGVLSEHSLDIAGLALVVAGIVVACGVYGSFAGRLGQWMETGLGASVGVLRFLLPPAFAALGVSLIREPIRQARMMLRAVGEEAVKAGEVSAPRTPSKTKPPKTSGKASSQNPARLNGGLNSSGIQAARSQLLGSDIAFRIIVGSVLLIGGASGLAHIMRGQPEWGDRVEDFATAGGAIGGAVGMPLESLMGGFAAGCVLAAVALFGFIMVSRTTLQSCASAVARVLAATGRGCAVLWRMADGSKGKERTLEGSTEDKTEGNTEDMPNVFSYEESKKSSPYDYEQDSSSAIAEGTDPADEFLLAADTDKSNETDTATDAATEAKSKKSRPKKNTSAPAAAAEVTDISGTTEDSAELDALASDETPSDKPAGKTSWKLPPLSLLNLAEKVDLDEVQARERGEILEKSLAALGVETRLVGMVVGPTVTRYELELAEGTKVSRLTSLNKDIAYAMASPDVRILAPIPGRRAIGVEVPNIGRQAVLIGDILSSQEAKKASHPLDVAVGRDITGRSILINLARMPHLLIAGSTGSGKSSCLNVMITSLLMRSTPDEVRMILVDPKMVEMRQFEQVPHLLTEPVTDPKKAANALNWAVKEMDRRYRLLSTAGFRDITGYNDAHAQGMFDGDEEFPRLPFMLVVVDELSDLMMVAPRDVEDAICRIAQMARAVGIHLVIATQRPSTNVITGVIKANIPARLAFSVSSLTDSRVILDQGGAERLVGQGDMLLLGPSSSAPRRVQGAWVSEAEVQKVAGAWRRQSKGDDHITGISSEDLTTPSSSSSMSSDSDDDELLQEAMEIVVSTGLGSTSMLQRKLRVGFARAGRLMDLLEQKGIVGPSEGSKAREVYMTPEELSGSSSPAQAESTALEAGKEGLNISTGGREAA